MNAFGGNITGRDPIASGALADGGDPVSANRIVTRYEDRPGTTYIGQRPAVGILPDGREIRLGYRVTGSYWHEDDVEGVVIGWDPELVVVDIGGPSSIELGPQHILTVEATR